MSGNWVGVSVKLDGVEVVSRRIASFSRSISDLRPAWPKVAEAFHRGEEQTFATEGGGKWPPLAPSTVRKRGSAHPILVMTGALRNSLSGRDARDGIFEPSALSLTIGTGVPYAGFHQKGTSRMPKRPPVSFGFKTKSEVVDALATYVRSVVRESGLAGSRS